MMHLCTRQNAGNIHLGSRDLRLLAADGGVRNRCSYRCHPPAAVVLMAVIAAL
jgi:hypothetical protein